MEKRLSTRLLPVFYLAAVITNYLVAWSTLMILQGQDKGNPIKNSQNLIC